MEYIPFLSAYGSGKNQMVSEQAELRNTWQYILLYYRFLCYFIHSFNLFSVCTIFIHVRCGHLYGKKYPTLMK